MRVVLPCRDGQQHSSPSPSRARGRVRGGEGPKKRRMRLWAVSITPIAAQNVDSVAAQPKKPLLRRRARRWKVKMDSTARPGEDVSHLPACFVCTDLPFSRILTRFQAKSGCKFGQTMLLCTIYYGFTISGPPQNQHSVSSCRQTRSIACKCRAPPSSV